MAIKTDLLNEIRNHLGKAITPNLTTSSAGSDIFEGYVFTMVIKAAQNEGAQILYKDVHGVIPASFVFRSSPGFIYSTVQQYTHAVISFNNKPLLEAHLGVRVVGKSGVLHELDIAVLEHAEAETCRRKKVPPRSVKCLIAVECKFYSTSLKLSLAREFIGLVSDNSAKAALFVSNTNSNTIQKLLTGRKMRWEHKIIPSSTLDVTRLRNEFQSIFKYYKAK